MATPCIVKGCAVSVSGVWDTVYSYAGMAVSWTGVLLAVCQYTLHQTVGNRSNPGPLPQLCFQCAVFYRSHRWTVESLLQPMVCHLVVPPVERRTPPRALPRHASSREVLLTAPDYVIWYVPEFPYAALLSGPIRSLWRNETHNARVTWHWGTFANCCCRGKAINITYLCVRACARARGRVRVALFIHHATRMRHILTSFLALQAVPFFRHYLTNGTIFEKEKKVLSIKCVFWFSLQPLCKTFLILRRI